MPCCWPKGHHSFAPRRIKRCKTRHAPACPTWGPVPNPTSALPRKLTVPVFVGQPVVLAIAVLKVQVPLTALLLPEVSQGVRAVLGIAELEVVGQAGAGAAPVGWAAREIKGSPSWGL